MYGAGHVFKGQADSYLDDDSLGNFPPNAEFGALSFVATPSTRVIAEALQDSHRYKIRRLHLIVVDTWSPWQYRSGEGGDRNQVQRANRNIIRTK